MTSLGINTLTDGWVTLSATDIKGLSAKQNLFLVDNERKIIQDLKLITSYRFYLPKGTYNNRLQLKITSSDSPLPDFQANQLFRLAQSSGKSMVVANLKPGETGRLTVTNILGQKLLDVEVSASQMVEIGSLQRTGILLVQMKSGQREQTEKTVIVPEN
jgi:predicted ribosome quality control (RQC) complex YloA/Tae2 family protein